MGDDLGCVIKRLLKEADVNIRDIPVGIEYHKRIGENETFDFFLNVSSESIELSSISGMNVITGEQIQGSVVLKEREYLVLKIE